MAAKLSAQVRISAAAARRIALAAQGFGRPRPDGPATARRIRTCVDRMAVLQLDSVNVLCRSHYLPVFARIGPYPREALDRLTAHTAGPIDRHYVEYWAHEASLVPMATIPLLRWRMDRAIDDAWAGLRALARNQPGLLAEVHRLVALRGPLRSVELGISGAPRRAGQMWNWHDGKIALEFLFWRGEISAARRINFERLYDLTERVLPLHIQQVPTPTRAEAQRELIRLAARALGVATEPDLGDYFRLPRAESTAQVAELVAAGELVPVMVEGWGVPAYLWPAAHRPRQVKARALLSPFDPLIWFRSRAQRLFGFHYRIEIYTPAAKRRYGYYVLPFLLGETVVARVDLKSDRAAGVLRVQAAWLEPGVVASGPSRGSAAPAMTAEFIAAELAAELAEMAQWLGLRGGVVVIHLGDLAVQLAKAVEG